MAIAKKLGDDGAAFATIRASVLASLLQKIEISQGKLEVLLACHGLIGSQLDDPYARIPLSRYISIFEEVAVLIGDPHLGARLGTAVRPADMGPVGILFSITPTIRAGFERLSKYVPALQGGTVTGLITDPDRLTWSYRIEDPRMWPRHQDSEYSLAASCQLIRTCFSPSWRPLEVHFEHHAPEEKTTLQRIFRAPILYGQSGNRLIMARTDAERLYRQEDRDLTGVIERHIADLIGRDAAENRLTHKVMSIISIYLGHKPITTRTVADELGLTVRTLQRRLTEEGTSLRELIGTYRRDLTRLYREDGRTRRSDIAEALGYADSTVLWRASRSWDVHPEKGRSEPV
jgi:AraC-like DNA-binding protein